MQHVLIHLKILPCASSTHAPYKMLTLNMNPCKWSVMCPQAIADALAKERAATAAMLQAAAAAQQPAFQHGSRPTSTFGSAHLSRQRQQQLSTDQELPFTRSRLGNQGPQQGVYRSQEHSNANAAMPAGHNVPRYGQKQINGQASELPSLGLSHLAGAADGAVGSQSSDDLREGFRRAVSAVPDEPRQTNAKSSDLMSCSINNVLPHVASWGNLSTHSSSSNSGLHGGLLDNLSRGLPIFEPISTPAGLFNSNGNNSGDKGSFPSYLASIWSSDAKSHGLSSSPNSHFEQPSLLNHH